MNRGIGLCSQDHKAVYSFHIVKDACQIQRLARYLKEILVLFFMDKGPLVCGSENSHKTMSLRIPLRGSFLKTLADNTSRVFAELTASKSRPPTVGTIILKGIAYVFSLLVYK